MLQDNLGITALLPTFTRLVSVGTLNVI